MTQQLPYTGPAISPGVGPPPRPPRPYEPYRTSHVLHLLLTIVTCGLWAPMWILLGVTSANADNRERRRFTEENAAYRAAYADWERRHYLAFGYVPQIPR